MAIDEVGTEVVVGVLFTSKCLLTSVEVSPLYFIKREQKSEFLYEIFQFLMSAINSNLKHTWVSVSL